MRRIYVLDTTLRDGAQREGISLSVEDSISIARRLDDLGVAFIETEVPALIPKMRNTSGEQQSPDSKTPLRRYSAQPAAKILPPVTMRG